MPSRSLAFAVVSTLVTICVGACHSTPDEKVNASDAGTSVLAASGAPLTDAAPRVYPIIPDAGRADVRAFCNDAYSADDERLATKCTPKDLNVNKGMARAAANLCADDMNSAVLHARASFDADAAKHCVDMLRSTPLERTSQDDTLFGHYPCDSVLVGSQPEGQPCRFSVECKEGLACEGYGIGVDGVCKKPPKLGDACIIQRFGNILNVAAVEPHHPACAAGLWCDGSKCQRRVAAGGSCGGTASCAAGLACVMGKCNKPGAVGAKCNVTADCAFGIWCDHTAGTGDGVCANRRGAGELCTSPEMCKGRCDMTNSVDAGAVRWGHCADVCSSG